MSANEILGQYTPRETNFHLSNMSETNLARANLSIEKPDGENLSENNQNTAITSEPTLILAPFLFLVMAGIIVSHKLRLLRLSNKQNNLHKVPCQNCKFFSNNNFLKCAVNPSTVLTKEAINCCDYHPKKMRKSFSFFKLSNQKPN